MEKIIGKRSPVNKGSFIAAVLNYFVGYTFVFPLLGMFVSALVLNFDGLAPVIAWVIYIGVLLITLYLLFPYLKESWPNFTKDVTKNILWVIIFTFALIVVATATSAIVSLIFGPDTSINQQEVELITRIQPVQTFFAIVIFAPVVEELVFRGCLYRSLSAKMPTTLAMVISALMFGAVHILAGILTFNLRDIAFILVYGSMGLVFVKVYDNTQNIISCILVHSLYNAISFAIMIGM